MKHGCMCIFLADKEARKIATNTIREVLTRDREKIIGDTVKFAQFLTQGRQRQ